MMRLGVAPDAWNKWADQQEARSSIERAWERRMFRSLLPRLDYSELRVLLFIKSRTLDWQKFAEAIPMSHFLHGIVDDAGELRVHEDEPVCSGCGIRKEDTVRGALKSLVAKRLVHVFRAKRGAVNAPNVYMPFAEDDLARQFLQYGEPVLPAHLKTLFVHEVVIARDVFWLIAGGQGENIQVVEWTKSGRAMGEVVVLHTSEIKRPSLYQWESFASSWRFSEALKKAKS